MILIRRKRRFLARLMAAVLYAACVLAPHLALALSHAGAHCLTPDHTAHSQIAHQHHGGSDAQDLGVPDHGSHGHDDAGAAEAPPSSSDRGNAGVCCELFGFAGLVAPLAGSSSTSVLTERVLAGVDAGLIGRAPDRINKPPIG